MLDRSIAISWRARDFMQTDLLVVAPETSVLDIHRLFVEEEIHGAPVVDDAGVVRGVVSTLDLARVVNDEADTASYSEPYFHAESWPIPSQLPERFTELTAGDIMTREIVSVSPNMPVADVAQTMRDQHVHRVLVMEGKKLLGVLTTFDLLRAFIRDESKPLYGTTHAIDYDPSA
jgi:CBS domain-containing protein